MIWLNKYPNLGQNESVWIILFMCQSKNGLKMEKRVASMNPRLKHITFREI